MRRTISLALAAALCAGGFGEAQACTWAVSYEELPERFVDPADMQAECRELYRHRPSALRRTAKGTYDADFVSELASRFETGEFGCPKDPRFALQLRAAMLPDPLGNDIDMFRQWAVLGVAKDLALRPDALQPARRLEITRMSWLLGYSDPRLDPAFGEGELAEFLARPENFRLAMDHPGIPARDELLLRLAADRTRADYDRGKAIRLAQNLAGGTRGLGPDPAKLFDGVELMLDSALGPPDIAAAEAMLAGFPVGPFYHLADFTPHEAALRAAWQRIGALHAQSGDAALRRKGEALLATGDPLAHLRVAGENVPADARIVEGWPVQFGDPAWERFAARLGASYPARALRTEETGPVEIALHYRADGTFAGRVVLVSSGSATLDGAALQAYERYLRPKPPETLPAGMASGQDLLFRLPVIEFHLRDWGERDEPAQFRGGHLIVNGVLVYRSDTDWHC